MKVDIYTTPPPRNTKSFMLIQLGDIRMGAVRAMQLTNTPP